MGRKRKCLISVPKNGEQFESIPNKTPKIQQCVIHSSSVNSGLSLTTPKDINSWKSLMNAGKALNHKQITEIGAATPDDKIPDIWYHRNCRDIYMLKLRERAKQTKKNVSLASLNKGKSRENSSKASSSAAGSMCIFCERHSKCPRKSDIKEKLTLCEDLRADQTVREKAIEKQDSRMIAIVTQELVAAKVWYHHSCYNDYTRNRPERVPLHVESDYDRVEKVAYGKLFDHIRHEVIEKDVVVKMLDIVHIFATFLAEAGFELPRSVSNNMQRKLKTVFGDNLVFVTGKSGKVLMFSDGLKREDLVRENECLKESLDSLKKSSEDNNSLIQSAASVLRKEVKDEIAGKKTPWPPFPFKLKSSPHMTPPLVQVFLKCLLTGVNKQEISPKMQRSIDSFGDDLVYAISCGKAKPAKHISLASVVKSMSCSVDLLQILNRYNQCISYSQLEEIDTAFALYKLSCEDDSIKLPQSIHPYLYTSLAWDNIDRLEETLSGGGTSHRVNGIAVQPVHFGPFQETSDTIVERLGLKSLTVNQKLLPIYNAGARVGPPIQKNNEIDCSQSNIHALERNLFWVIARVLTPKDKLLPSWTGFNILVSDSSKIVHDSIAYLPTINAPATEMTTVQEILVQSKSIMNSLKLDSIVVVFDQALYAKATEIIWKQPDRFENIIPRLGVFHTLCTMLGIIGKRFQDAGLRDLYIESGVIAEGSVLGVLSGRQYNRSVRCVKLVYEAFLQLAWKDFPEWLDSHYAGEDKPDLDLLSTVLCDFSCDPNYKSFAEKFQATSFQCAVKQFREYLDHLRNQQGDLSEFWMSFIDMASIVLDLIRASREGDLDLHLSGIRRMIPWCFAYDNINYARYLSWYYSEMVALPQKHPEADAYLRAGGLSVQIGECNPFGRIPVDQTIEETVNKDTQSGGTRGFSLMPGAISRYYLTSEYRSGFLQLLRDSLQLSKPTNCHKDLHKSRIQRDGTDVEKLISMIESCWINPFSSENTILVGLSTGVQAPDAIKKDLLGAHTTGEKAYKLFKEERLENDPPVRKFHDPMTKRNLKTFSHMKKTRITTAADGQKVILKSDIHTFSHIILIAEIRKLCMRKVMSYPLGVFPWSLATSDGTPRKTNKAVLAKEVQKGISPVDSFGPHKKACVIDLMGIVQKVKGDKQTFSNLSSIIFAIILREGSECKRIDVVSDVYKTGSIKQLERIRRGQTLGTEYRQIAPGHTIYQWRKFLQNPQNKQGLIEFLVSQWQLPSYRKFVKGKELYVTCGEMCYKLSSNGSSVVSSLKSNHEEADTRVIVHAAHASKAGYKSIIMVSEDTDVMVLCLANNANINSKIFMKQGTKTRTKYIDISKMAGRLGHDVCEALIGLHAFTGCDTVSAFAGKGKVAALKIIRKDPELNEAMKRLGKQWNLTPELFQLIEKLTCQIYQSKTVSTEVNDLRYGLFQFKKGKIESWQLPPCKASLWKHSLRANFQAATWRLCLTLNPQIPSFLDHGWCLDKDDVLTIDWFDKAAAPDAVLELMSCKCPRVCQAPDCPCVTNGMKCTPACKNQTCQNQKEEDEEDESLDDTDVEEEGEDEEEDEEDSD